MFGNEIKIGKIFGITIAIDMTWFIILALITWSFAFELMPRIVPEIGIISQILFGVLASLIFFGSVLAHELGHSLIARKNGLPIEKITLFLFGGVSNLTEEPESPSLELKMAATGPAVSIVIGIVLVGLSYLEILFQYDALFILLGVLGVINFFLAGFNLLPGYPLDGGRILRAIIWMITDDYKKSTRYASIGGQIIAGAMIALGIIQFVITGILSGLWLVFIGYFLFRTARFSVQQGKIMRILKREKIGDIANQNYPNIKKTKNVTDAAKEAMEKRVDLFIVVDRNDMPQGILTIENIKNVEDKEILKVGDIYRSFEELPKLKTGEEALKAFRSFNENDAQAIPVYDNDNFIGIITLRDLRYFITLRG